MILQNHYYRTIESVVSLRALIEQNMHPSFPNVRSPWLVKEILAAINPVIPNGNTIVANEYERYFDIFQISRVRFLNNVYEFCGLLHGYFIDDEYQQIIRMRLRIKDAIKRMLVRSEDFLELKK